MRILPSRFALETLSDAGWMLFDALFPREYAQSGPTRWLFGADNRHRTISRHTLSSVLSRLQRQGLVECRGKSLGSQWHITPKGIASVKDYAKEAMVHLVPPEDGIVRLVIFDIPEKERKKRNTIRAELVASGFDQLQKSVWIGHRALPEEFIALIDDLSLKKRVHIFSVHHEGTLKKE